MGFFQDLAMGVGTPYRMIFHGESHTRAATNMGRFLYGSRGASDAQWDAAIRREEGGGPTTVGGAAAGSVQTGGGNPPSPQQNIVNDEFFGNGNITGDPNRR